MKKYLFFILLIIGYVDVYADVVYSGNVSINAFDDVNVIVENEAILTASDESGIFMNDIVYLYNNGTINSSINTDGNILFVYNNGAINGDIINSNGGNVTQFFNPATGINNINVNGGNFCVNIENLSNLNFSDIKNINATSFDIKDSYIIINNFADWQSWNKNVNTSGTIHLIITDENIENYDGEIINNISGDIALDIETPGLDSSKRPDKEYLGGQYQLKIIRTTDYSVINNGENSVVEEIRVSDPDDKLVNALDSANGIDEINYIKNKSYRFNHGILLRPIRVINNFILMDNVDDKNDFGLGFKPVYIVSDKISNIGGHIYAGYHHDDLYFKVGLNLNRFRYSDDLNEFSGFVYCMNIKLKQYVDKLWVSGMGAVAFADFDANYISEGNKVKNNPHGVSWYTGIDSGYDFDISNGFVLSPVFGIAYQNYSIADVLDSNFYIRGGAELKYSFITDGIKYEYGLDGSVATNGNLYSSVKFGFWSVTDEAGATLSVGMLQDDLDYNYQLSVNAKMLF